MSLEATGHSLCGFFILSRCYEYGEKGGFFFLNCTSRGTNVHSGMEKRLTVSSMESIYMLSKEVGWLDLRSQGLFSPRLTQSCGEVFLPSIGVGLNVAAPGWFHYWFLVPSRCSSFGEEVGCAVDGVTMGTLQRVLDDWA